MLLEKTIRGEEKMNSTQFRDELIKLMPGYKWTVHRPLYRGSPRIVATGIQSSGFNRLSTLQVDRLEKDEDIRYCVKSAGFGSSASWLSECTDGTLARALRELQNHYEDMADNYSNHAVSLQAGRKRLMRG